MVFGLRKRKQTRAEIGTRENATALTDLTMSYLEGPWDRKALECSDFMELFFGNLEDKNAEWNAENVEIWLVKIQREVWDSLKDYQGHFCAIWK